MSISRCKELVRRRLADIDEAAEEENVSWAALKLHVSQPSISRQIRDLEEEIWFSPV